MQFVWFLARRWTSNCPLCCCSDIWARYARFLPNADALRTCMAEKLFINRPQPRLFPVSQERSSGVVYSASRNSAITHIYICGSFITTTVYFSTDPCGCSQSLLICNHGTHDLSCKTANAQHPDLTLAENSRAMSIPGTLHFWTSMHTNINACGGIECSIKSQAVWWNPSYLFFVFRLLTTLTVQT